MFISPIFEHLGDLSPLFALVPHMGYQNVVLFELPLLFGFVWVKMVQPSFPALLWSPEELALRSDVELFGQLAPLVLLTSVPE